MSPLTLNRPVGDIDSRLANRRMGLREKGPPAHRVLAEQLGIRTVEQLLRHYPRRYIDRSTTVAIGQVRIGQEVTVIGRVTAVNKRRTRGRKPMDMVTVKVFDGTGYVDVTFFNQPWAATMYRKGMELAISGTARRYKGRLQLVNQEVEVLRAVDGEGVHTGRIIPVHPAAQGISTRTIRELVHRALQRLSAIPDPIPQSLVEAEALAEEDEALRQIHFPRDPEGRDRAVNRLKFDELFALELGVAFRKRRIEATSTGIAHTAASDPLEPFVRSLPFRPTEAQRRAMKEVASDMALPRPMNRLLQGDVGSGKTAVALFAAMVAIRSGRQAAIMAPTEVLAGQHARTAADILGPMGGRDIHSLPSLETDGQQTLLREAPDEATRLTFALLTASVTGRERDRVRSGVADGRVDLVIGTHALVQEEITFSALSLAVIDEQHRFGVHQRLTLKEKGAQPDVLIMTATPIPRTLALTYYGDLDVSILDEMPSGRQPVFTRVARSASERSQAYDLVRKEVSAGHQAFVVCAAIDEANRLEVKAAEKEAERLATEVFPDLRILLLHGRMRPDRKEAAMQAFRAGEADVLISTTVIEVGVDVPNATVMLVENAERFGLAQLHQLRGRIGRGPHRSHCVLFDESAPGSEDAKDRLAAMVRTTDGFELADEDLRLRGEGTLFDIRQSGMPDLKLARLADDAALVRRARLRAFALIDSDPLLERHPELLRLLRERFSGEAIEWLFHG